MTVRRQSLYLKFYPIRIWKDEKNLNYKPVSLFSEEPTTSKISKTSATESAPGDSNRSSKKKLLKSFLGKRRSSSSAGQAKADINLSEQPNRPPAHSESVGVILQNRTPIVTLADIDDLENIDSEPQTMR